GSSSCVRARPRPAAGGASGATSTPTSAASSARRRAPSSGWASRATPTTRIRRAAPASAPSPSSRADPVRIVAWNIRAGGGARVDAIARQLRGWAPDVVALSEFRATPPSAELAARLAAAGLGHQLTTADRRSPGSNGLLVASRFPLRRVRLRAAPADRLRWLVTAIDAPVPLVVGGMHVPNRVSGRKYP